MNEKEIKSLNKDDLDVEGMSPEELEEASGGGPISPNCQGTYIECSGTYNA